MKTIFTKSTNIPLVLLLVIFSYASVAQTKHTVEVSNNKFTPKQLTIRAGDTVEWKNIQGSHNVNGTTSTYSSNPESFGNSVGSNWTYSYVFNTPGTYDYRCDPHIAFGMVGSIVVEATTGIENILTSGSFKMFPNPAREQVTIEFENLSSPDVLIKFYNLTGKTVFSEMYPADIRIEINIEQMVSGIYFVELSDATNRKMVKLVKE
ncbi:MAG: T9SS type A sorting domain-containing protein [Prolixibacteraceae bacterium]|nr:T9SS type A sorting domain-containing protein [Prolixibacteraceae bacterium]